MKNGCEHKRNRCQELITLFVLLQCITASGADVQMSTAPYTVEFTVQSRYLNPAGHILQDEQVEVRVSVDSNQVMIQSRSPTNENVCPLAWATSPVRAQEWITAYPPIPPDGTHGLGSYEFDTVIVEKSPYSSGSDLLVRLGQFLYIPTNHTTFRGCSERDIWCNAGESFGYTPTEVTFRTRRQPFGSRNLPVQIAAYTPKYYYEPAASRMPFAGLPLNLSKSLANAMVKVPFAGPPFERKLWVLSIQQYTNWNGLLLATSFSYERYQDPPLRAKVDSDTVVVSVEGALVSIRRGAMADINPQLRPHLTVVDLRPQGELYGQPARYQAENGKWPAVGTQEYREIVRASKAELARQYGLGGSHLHTNLAFLAAFLLLLIAPAVWISIRKKHEGSL